MGEEDARKSEKLAKGEEVPMPMLPSGSTVRSVDVVEPIMNGMTEPDAFTLSVAKGEVVPIPTFDAKVLFAVVEVETM
jgi:hypothetical protein